MKRRDLETRLRELGWWLLRHGRRHDVWTNGEIEEAVPRHNEIDDRLARKILKKAEGP
ncbi:MAG: type II toxin-antitoxin system HicA family toxin [Planctomycetes bacterium]|nr:type II toxin-antitoxin system HicA family toxin [Planctomycetota bacterium]MBI4614827.1 type II toxin-antitoxin system HicA family toxin [Planctomycetota bacterium]